MDNFNKETFIDEVQKRPVIWNTECPEYADRMLKRKAWQELTEIFADPNYSNEKKSIFCIQLQRKWKNLKDTYVKEYKKIRSNASPSSQKSSSYMYYTKLSFLEKGLQTKPKTSSSDSQMMDVDTAAKASELLASMHDSLAELMETASSLEKSSLNKLKSSESPNRLKEHKSSSPISMFKDYRTIDNSLDLDMEQKSRQPFFDTVDSFMESRKRTSSKRHTDDDKLFCLSLYKEIKKVPEINRLSAKIELLNVLQRAQTLPTSEFPMNPQYASVVGSVSSPWQYVTKPYNVSNLSTVPRTLQKKLKSAPSTSTEQHSPGQYLVPPFQEDLILEQSSPVSSLASSFSSNCSINNNYMDTQF